MPDFGAANTERHGDVPERRWRLKGCHGSADAFRNRECLPGCRHRQHDDKFIAAIATDGIRSAEFGAGTVGDLLQDQVAHRMPEGVIDLFEGVNVEQQHGQRLPIPRGDVKLMQRQVHQGAVVMHSGQHISVRQLLFAGDRLLEFTVGCFERFFGVAQLLVRLLALGNVGDEAVPEHRTIRLPLWRCVAEEPVDRTIVKFDPIFMTPRQQVPRRFLYGGNDTAVIIRMKPGKYRRRIILNLIRADLQNLANSIIGEGDAGTAVGA